MAKKKAKPFKKVVTGWVPEDEAFDQTYDIGPGYVFKTRRECRSENPSIKAINRRITTIIEDV